MKNLIRATEDEILKAGGIEPAAVISRSIQQFEADGIVFDTGCDDFDFWHNASYFINGTPFALHHYDRSPSENTTDIHLPFSYTLQQVSDILDVILPEFRLTINDVNWRR